MDDPVAKSGGTVPVSQEMLDDAPVDIWTATIQPPSPLERAWLDVEEASARLEEAREALARAEDEYEAQCVTPGSHVRPPPYKIADALGAAATAQLERLNAELVEGRRLTIEEAANRIKP